MRRFGQLILSARKESDRPRRFGSCTYLVVLLAALVLAGCKPESEARKADDAPKSDSKGSTASTDRGETRDPVVPRVKPSASQGRAQPEQHTPVAAFEQLKLLGSIEAHFINVEAMAFGPDNQTFVTGGSTPSIWKIGRNEPLFAFDELYPLTGTIVKGEAIAISTDGSLLAIAGGDGIAHLFDFATRETKQEIRAHDQGVVSVSFSQDGKKLATSGYDGKAKIWNTETGEQIAACDIEKEKRVRSAISPDGKVLVSAGAEALLWSAETGEKLAELNRGEPRDMSVWAVDFSSDGKQIVTGDATVDFANAALIWSAETRKLTATLKHNFGVFHVAFSPDGTLLATADVNGVARIWRLADQTLVQTIELEEVNSTDAIAWAPNGKILAVAADGTVRFWGPPGAIETLAAIETPDEADQNEDTLQNTEPDVPETTVESDPKVHEDTSTDALSVSPETRFEEATPLTVTEATAIFDATQFPAPGSTPASESSGPTSALFRIREEFPKVVDETVKAFENLNWKVVAQDDSAENRVAFYLRNQQILLSCKVRQERKSLTRMDLEILGNIDIRSIAKTEVDEILYDYLDYVVYRTNASLDEIVAFYDQMLTDAGWQRYRQFDGLRETFDNRRHLMYRNRGVGINVSADSRGGEIIASLFCEMLEQDVPTPQDATEVELDDHLVRQRFRSTQTVSQLAEFFTSEMKRFGWTMPFGKQFEDAKAGMLFTRPVGDPVYLELLSRDDGSTIAYMAGPTRQVTRAVKDEFEIEYENSLPLGETHMHTVPYQSIPFNQPEEEGSGRTIAESVFYNTKTSLEENFDFYRAHFSKLGWEAGDRKDEYIGDSLQRATVTFKKADAEIVVAAGSWVQNTNRVSVSGNGIEWPGDAFCHMMARPNEAKDVE